MKRATLGAALMIAALSSLCLTADCRGEEVFFEDAFKTQDPAWGKNAEISDGKLVLSEDKASRRTVINQSAIFQDMTLGITARLLNGARGSSFGVVFLAKDYNDWYSVGINWSGQLSVFRWVGERYLVPVAWRVCPEVASGLGKPNAIEVLVRGKAVTININGKDVVTFNRQMPAGGGSIGFFVEGDEKEKTVAEFSKLKVTK